MVDWQITEALPARPLTKPPPLLIALAYNNRDAMLASKLLRWMKELDGTHTDHSLVLLASKGTKPQFITLLAGEARKAFSSVEAIMPNAANEEGWPRSANHLFLSAYHHIGNVPFLWIEPDCVPLKPFWLDFLSEEYTLNGKPFMGCIYERPFPHLTGCAIYPANIESYNPMILHPGADAWDVVAPNRTLPHVHHTLLFQHEWGNGKYNIAPSFSSQRSVQIVRKDAVLFHRCKDGSLIDRLSERRRWPGMCRNLAKFGMERNGFQDYDDDWQKEKA